MGRQLIAQPTKRSESGQAVILVILAMSIFLLGVLGFAVDFANLYFHQQRAQSAADAACQATGMDLLTIQEGANTAASAGFTPGTNFDCASASTAAPCQYAAINGYSGAGLTAGTESNKVSVSFPTSVTGVTAPPVAVGGSYPFIEVDVVDRVRVFFSALMTLSRTQDVKVIAKCGLQQDTSPIPILVLDTNPTKTGYTFSVQGTPTVAIYGGPTRSIQVNSPAAAAISIGGSATVNLSKGGPSHNGSIMGVTGGPYTLATMAPKTTSFLPYSNAYYAPSDDPISDPFAQLAAPSNSGMTTYPKISTTVVTHNTNGCPDPAGCQEYLPGYYPNGIQVKNTTAIFDPGVYYVGGSGFAMDANSTLRPAIIGGNATGTMFYLSGTGGSISVAADSGTKTLAKDGIDQFNTSYVTCPGGTAQTVTDTSGNTVTALDGNILLGMCSGTYGDPLGQNRGMLYFEDRSATLSSTNQPNFGGGGTFLMAGNLYFHNCNSSGTGATPCTGSGAYTDQLSLGGNSGSGTYVLGDIVTDQLTLGGTSGISMQLNPTSAYNILKVELLQ